MRTFRGLLDFLRTTCSHLWPSSDDKTRQVLDKAFATVGALHADSAHC